MKTAAELSPQELQFQVAQLLGAYVEAIDDDQLEKWPEFFVDECVYKIISRENADSGLPAAAMFCDSKGMLRDRVVSLRHANIYARHYYRHLLSNILVKEVDGLVARVQSNYLVLQTLLNGDTSVFNAGKYLDRVVFTEQGSRFLEKVVVFDTYRIPNLLVTPI